MKKKVSVQYAFAPASLFKDPDSDKAVNTLQELRDRLLQNEDFNSVLSNWNQKNTPLTFTKSPIVLSWSEKSSPDFLYDIAFQMRKGQVSKPAKNADGYYVVFVSDVTPVKLPPFKKMRNMLKEKCKVEMQKDLESQYFQFINHLKRRYKRADHPQKGMTAESAYADSLIVKWAYQKNYDDKAFIRKRLKKYRESIIRKEFEKETFYMDDHNSFSSTIASLHGTARVVDVREIWVDDPFLAKMISKRAQEGEDFSKLAAEYNESPSMSVKRYHIPTSANRSPIAALATEMKAGEVSRPINVNGRYAIFKVLQNGLYDQTSYNRKEPENRFKQTDNSASVKEKWLQSMRENMNVVIHESTLRAL
jgi:parvulin-like peptidyl-prolyl isomerase